MTRVVRNRFLRVVLRAVSGLILAALVCGAALAWVIRSSETERAILPFPTHRSCAIAIIDDTDFFQFDTAGLVYDLLEELGLRVTKTVWVFDSTLRPPEKTGLSLENAEYARWVAQARARGHEITLHSASADDDDRARMLAGYERLRELTGEYPRLDVFHSVNREAFYWGAERFPRGPLRVLYRAVRGARFSGQDPGSPFYWVDVARARVRYIRNYTFNDIDTWALNPNLPYEDPTTPGAPLWFASSNGRTVDEFVLLLGAESVRQLAAARSVSFVYTHFGSRFARRGSDGSAVYAEGFREVLEQAVRMREVEFVPAGELLDRMRAGQIVEDALAAGARLVRIPKVLEPAVQGLSVEPARIPRSWPLGEAARRPGRVSFLDWARANAIAVVPSDSGVFENARRLGARERWRMVARWLLTQIVSPT